MTTLDVVPKKNPEPSAEERAILELVCGIDQAGYSQT
jgi:hypothetical protein